MSAFLALLGGAAGEWNKMDEEKRAAAAQKAKQEAEAVAAQKALEDEYNWWEKKQEYTAGQEETKAIADRRAQQEAQQERYTQLVPELQMLNTSVPNQFHYISRSTEGGMPSIKSVDRPTQGYTFADAINIAKEQNAQLQDFGVFYVPEPLADNPQQFTLDIRTLDEKDEGVLFSSQADAQSAAEVEANRLEAAGVTNLSPVVIPTSDGRNWTYKTEKTTDEPEAAGPPKDPELGIPFNSNYYYLKSLKYGKETGKTAQQRGGQIISLMPETQLPLSGEAMKNFVENEDYLIIRRPMGVEGDADRANMDMTFFFDDFRPEIVDKILENKDSTYGRRGYELLRSRVSEVLQNWTLGTSDEIPAGRQLMPLPAIYAERLEEFAEKDPGIRRILRNHPNNDGTATELNNQVFNPVNEPIMVRGDGGAEVRRNVNFADAFVEEDEETGVFRYPDNIVQSVNALADNSKKQPAYIHGLHNTAIDPETGERTPEAAREAFYGTVENKEILSGYQFRTVRGQRAQYSFPSILADDLSRIVDNLANFNTDKERVDALEVAIPPLMAKKAHASAQVSATSGPAALYESVTGNSDYGDLQGQLNNANKILTINTELQTLLGSLEGDVGIPNQITLLKKGANYLLNNVIPGLGSEANLDLKAVNQGLRKELEEATRGTDLEAQVAALVRLNVKMQSYAFASMMDENGRLSDQDIERSEVAMGSEGFTANKDTVLAVSARLSSTARRRATMINGYTSNEPRRVLATHLYGRVAGGMATNVVELLGVQGPARLAEERTGTTGPTTATQTMQNIDIINSTLGAGTVETPTPAPTSTVNTEDEEL